MELCLHDLYTIERNGLLLKVTRHFRILFCNTLVCQLRKFVKFSFLRFVF